MVIQRASSYPPPNWSKLKHLNNSFLFPGNKLWGSPLPNFPQMTDDRWIATLPCHLPPFHSPNTQERFYLFLLDSVTVPVHDSLQCTSTSLLCFPWKAGVKLSPPSCSHQCFVHREFPINPNRLHTEGCRETEDKPRGCTSQSPLPHPNPLAQISFHSRSGDSFSGPRLSREFREVWFIQRECGAPIVARGSLLMYVLCGKSLTRDRILVVFVQKWRSGQKQRKEKFNTDLK